MSPREIGPFREYPTGTVYLAGLVIGHRVCPEVPALSRLGEGCGPGWRIERDPARCREFERLEGRAR